MSFFIIVGIFEIVNDVNVIKLIKLLFMYVCGESCWLLFVWWLLYMVVVIILFEVCLLLGRVSLLL